MITGGARSGKSAFAERYAAHLGTQGTYIATCEWIDEEMQDRIAKHREQREASGFPWTTLEEPYNLAERLGLLSGCDMQEAGLDAKRTVVLVDCLTVWLSNWLLTEEDAPKPNATAAQIDRLLKAAAEFDGTLLLVTNEVGGGLVPEYRLGRLYRDLAGQLNRKLAAVSDRVFLVTAGIPMELKSRAFSFGDD